MKKNIILITILMLFLAHLSAQKLSPVGDWKTIDDVTGKPKSIVKLWIENDVLYGKVEKLFQLFIMRQMA